MKKSMKLARFLKCQTKRFISVSLVAVLLLGLFTATDIYYDAPAAFEVHAKELEGITSNVVAPLWNAANIPTRDTTGTVKYYFAGNEFHALNQFSDGVQQNGSGTNGHLQIYSDTYGARLVETTYNGEKAVKGNFNGGSDFNTYNQRKDIDFSKTWELMDTNAIWDNQYLFAQYKTNAFAEVKAAFTPTILTTVNDWFENGFSYDGSANSRPTITASGESWFSDAEKNAVKSATVKTDGNEGSSNTNEVGDTIENAKLFAASIDEMYYNPVQVEEVIANLAADKSNLYHAESWQYARSCLWSRSWWGVNSNGGRSGFGVNSTGQVSDGNVANEFAVAPAFYLDLEQVKMARSAQAGTDVTASSSLAAYNPQTLDSSNGVKFLIQDENFASNFTSSINGKSTANIVAGNTYTIDYSGAVTTPVNSIGSDDNGKMVISAAIYDNAGNALYYGPLANATSESGNVSITIPNGLSNGTYTLALFEEQLGGTSTWNTKDNSNNGTTFTQADGYGTYVNYETDYMSGSVAYMNIALADDEFEVTVNDDAVMYAGNTYSARDIDELVSATIGSDSLTTGEYYVMTQEVYHQLGTAYNDVTTSPLVNTVTTEENPGNDATELTLVFVYFVSRTANPQIIERTFTVEADSIEGSVDFDSSTWYESTENNITWHYKLDGNGNIIGLYTEDSIVPIVDGGGALNIPSKVAGRTVVAVGGGTEDTPVVPSSETSWTSISFPSTVTTINDYGFYNTKAMANIVIPSHVTRIGTKAFYLSSITSVKVNEMNGTIGSLAFGANYSLTNVTLKGGNSGMTVSTIAFRDSGVQSVTIKGKVTINKNAFKNNTRLSKVNISGNVNVGEYAFTGCTAVDSLVISGTTKINSYAFNNLTCLTQLYLPEGTTVEEYAFNGCTSLTKLEADVNLVNHAFEGCDKINTLVLGENVGKVEYDWEGHSGTYEARKVYVKNKNTLFEFYGNEGTYVSAFGSAGNVIVYLFNDATVDQGTDVEAINNIKTLKGYTCYAHKGNYSDYITGSASSVTLYRVNSIESQMSGDGVSDMEITSSTTQTGIEAYYNGVILTTKDINKDNMTVIPVYGSDEGDRAYVSDAFYIIRTTEFNALENANSVTESEVASYEPVHADSEDLDAGQETGTISVTVIVFYEDESGAAKYFSTPVTIRVEEYNAKSYVEQEYGSYENIAEELASLTDKVKELEAEIIELEESKGADTATITKLQGELNTYKKAYEDLVEAFADYVSANEADGSGYFGTITGSSGVSEDVVYIEGNATLFEKTEVTTSDGKTIHTAEYDTDGDGTEETIYFYVDAEGVHLTDASGNSTGTVYTDTLGVIERETAAQLLEIKNTLASCESGLTKIIAALKDAGYDIDVNISIDEQYKQIVNAIKDMADKMADLEADLNTANDSVSSYESALASIYSLLTGSTLEADDITGINNTLNAIINKIQTLQNNLQVAQATVKDLQSQLEEAESAYCELEAELGTTKELLTQANAALSAAQAEKDALVEEYEKAIAEGEEKAASALQAQIAEKQAVIDQLEATQAALEQKEQDILEAQNTITSLQSQIDVKNVEIGELQRQLEALSSSADGLTSIIEALKDAGYDIDIDLTIDEQYKQIVEAIKDMAEKMADLEADLDTANDSVSSYESALASIYSLLTGSTLEADDITGINNTLNAIINKIQTLQNNLQVAQATVKDLQNQLEEAESAYSELEAELGTTKEQLQQAKSALSEAQAQKDALVEEYEKAIAEGNEEAAAALQAQIAEKQAVIDRLEATQAALEQKEKDILEAQNTITSLQSQIDAKNAEIADLQRQLDALSTSADGFVITVETANELFGLTLAAGSTDEEVYNAIVTYVQEKLATDQTIAAIQALVNSKNTGDALVRDVENAINAGNSDKNDECEHEGWIDDSVVNSSSNNYKSGYNAGYAEGIKVNSGNNGGSSASDAATSASLSTQISTLTSENKNLKNEVEDLEDEVDDLEDEIDDLKDEKSTLNSKVSTLTNKNNELASSVETLTSSNSTLNTKVNSLTKSNETLSDEISSLKSQLSKANATNKSTVATTTKNKEETKEVTKEETTVKEEKVAAKPETQITVEETKPDVMVSGTLTTVETVTGLGNVVQLEMDEVKSSSAASNQKGTGALIKLPENGSVISTINTNGSEANAVSVDSINNAYVIMEYYTNHLDELGELGSEDITSAVKDASKAVIMETVVSADIKPSPTQEAAIKNGVTTKVNVSFDGIDNNSLYLVIHESEARVGTYDVTMVKPKNGMLEFSLADLSPVTIAKVKVDNVSNLNLVEDQDVESVDGPVEGNSNNTLRFVVYGLIIVALLIGVGVIVYMKLKGSSLVKDDEEE